MSTEKIAYQCDENGYYLGEVVADESPLEPGVFLIPGGCVERMPPEPVKGKIARHTGKKWVMEDVPEPSTPSREELEQIVMAQRQSAYRLESDPLYMEWQYDQTEESEQAWRDKVAQIKGRYPLP